MPRTTASFTFHDPMMDDRYVVEIAPQDCNPARPGMVRVEQTAGVLIGHILLNRAGALKLIDALRAYPWEDLPDDRE